MLISTYEVAVVFATYMVPPLTECQCNFVTDSFTECVTPMQLGPGTVVR
jgi:hypothetical protein